MTSSDAVPYFNFKSLILLSFMLQWSQLGELADTPRGLSMKATAIVAVVFSFAKLQKSMFFRLKY